MEVEVEAKWVIPDLEPVRAKLEALNATCMYRERLTTRRTFDEATGTLAARGGWVRVRQDGSKVELTSKEVRERSLHGTYELTVEVSDYATTCAFLETIGLIAKGYQETKRELWQLGGCEVALDSWPWIPSTVEVEGPNGDAVRHVAEQLGFRWDEALYGSIENVYVRYYDVSEDEVVKWPQIVFSSPPPWLEAKRRQV